MINNLEEYPHNGPIEDYHPTVESIVTFLRSAIKEVGNDIYEYDSFPLGENDNESYILLVGWSYGFDYEETDGYGLCAKICIDDDAIGCEYDDFNMPYTLNGDVWDSNCEISDDPNSLSIEEDAKWFLKEWQAFVEAYMDSEEFLNPNYEEDSDDEDIDEW